MGAIGVIAFIAGLLMYNPVAKKTKQYIKEGDMEKVKEGKALRNGMVLMIGCGLLLIFLEFYTT